MKVCACFLLFTIFALTNTTVQKDPENPANLRLEWESFLGFDTKHKKYNFKFLDDVNDFISEVKFAVISNKNPTRVGVKRKDNQDDIVLTEGNDRNNVAKHTKYDQETKRESRGLNASKVFGDTIKFSIEYQPYEPEDDNNEQTTKSRKLSKAFDDKDNKNNMNKSHKDTYGLKPRADDDEKQKRAKDFERSIEEDGLKHDEKYDEEQPRPKDEKTKLSSDENLPTGSTEGKYKELLHNKEKKYQKYDEERPMPKVEKAKLSKEKDLKTLGSYESMHKEQLESVIPDLAVNAPSSAITTSSTKSMFTPPPSLSDGGHKQLKPDRLLRPMGKEDSETDTEKKTEKSPSPTPSSSHWFITAKHAESNKQTKPKVETNKDKDSQEGLWAGQTTSTESEEKTMRRDTKTSEAKKKPEKVHNVLKRINELEKELTDVKNELGNIKIRKELRTQKQMIDFGWTIDTRNAQKSGRKSLLTKTENYNKMDNENAKFKYLKRNNSDNMTDKIDTYDFDSNKVSKTKEKTFATQTNFIFRVNSGTKATKGMKLMIEDLDYVNPKDPRLRNDYEGIDEWKALKFARIDSKTPFKFTTVRAAKSTVKPSTTTTVKSVLISSKSPAVPISTVKPVLTSPKSPVVQRAVDSKVTEKNTSFLNDDIIKVSTPTKKVVTEINSNITDENIVDFML